MSTDELLELAARLGITVTYHTGGPKGGYDHAALTISLRHGLGPVATRCTLAHELGHAIHGDTPDYMATYGARAERAADMWAAQTLISPAAYQAAEHLVGPHPGALAHELGVTRHLIDVWRATTHQKATLQ